MLTLSLLYFSPAGGAGQKVRVDEQLEAYPTKSVDLRCVFVDGLGTKLTQVWKCGSESLQRREQLFFVFFVFIISGRSKLTRPETFYSNRGKNYSKSRVLDFQFHPSVMSPRVRTKSIVIFFSSHDNSNCSLLYIFFVRQSNREEGCFAH